MTYSLVRLRDGAGDSGGMSQLMWRDHDQDETHYEQNGKPRVGVVIRVGSLFPRTYSLQDWWQTTYITQIIDDFGDRVIFKTANSIYEWKKF